MDKQASDVSLIFLLSSLTTHTESLALTHHISRAPFIFLRCSPFVAVPLPSCRLFLSRATSNLSRLADPSHQSPSFFDDVYFSSSFRNMLLFVPLSAVMSFLAALTTSLSILHSSLCRSPFLPLQYRSTLLTLAARVQSHVLIARTRATDICSRCPFLGEVSHRSRCTRES